MKNEKTGANNFLAFFSNSYNVQNNENIWLGKNETIYSKVLNVQMNTN